jgi:hypothetical protein
MTVGYFSVRNFHVGFLRVRIYPVTVLKHAFEELTKCLLHLGSLETDCNLMC